MTSWSDIEFEQVGSRDDDRPPLRDEKKVDPFLDENEIDFDDERVEDQYPLDIEEAREAGALLDDPERMEPDDA